MSGFIGLCVVAGIAWCLCSGKRQTRATLPISHRSGFSNAHVRRHEEGHARVARRLGCRVRVDLDKGETVVLSGPRLTPAECAAIAYGGRAAAGGGGCGGDDRIAEQHLRRVPASERGAARREAKRIARRYA